MSKVEIELSNHYTNLRVAEERIKMGNQKLQGALPEKSLSREKIRSSQAMIDMRLD